MGLGFGQITTTATPARQVQFALKYRFECRPWGPAILACEILDGKVELAPGLRSAKGRFERASPKRDAGSLKATNFDPTAIATYSLPSRPIHVIGTDSAMASRFLFQDFPSNGIHFRNAQPVKRMILVVSAAAIKGRPSKRPVLL